MHKGLQAIVLRCCGWLAKLIPFLIGGFIATSLIQISAYESIIIKSAKLKTDATNYLTNKTESSELPQKSTNNSTNSTANIPIWKQPILFDISNFHWIMNNENICKLDERELKENARVVIIIVHTSRDHFEERLAIRKSYGSLPMYKNWVVRTAFLLGEPDPSRNSTSDLKDLKKERAKLFKEHQKYGDLVIGSFVDSYHNLSYKHIMGYKWVLNFCLDAKFVMKVDDDMFVDLMRWLDWRTKDLKILEKNSSAVIPDLYGFDFGGGKPERDKNSKWYASEEDWPGDRRYPSYCSGWSYGINIDLMKRLYLATQKVKFFWIDDVFVTGALMEEVKTHDPKPELRYLGDKMTGKIEDYRPMCEKQAYYKKRKFKSVAYIPRGEFFERDLMCLWNKTMHDTKYKFKV